MNDDPGRFAMIQTMRAMGRLKPESVPAAMTTEPGPLRDG